MDKNQSIGITLIVALVGAYFFYVTSTESADQKRKSGADTTNIVTIQDSSEKVVSIPSKEDTSPEPDSTEKEETNAKPLVKEELYTVKTKDLRLVFSNLGGQIKEVELLNYTTFEDKPLILFEGATSKLSVKAGDIDLSSKSFSTVLKPVTTVSTDTLVVTFKSGKHEVTYKVPQEGYVLKTSYKNVGKGLNIDWRDELKVFENDLTFSYRESGAYYYSEDGFESFGDGQSNDVERPEGKVSWVTHKQRFFNAGLISLDEGFINTEVSTKNEGLTQGTFKETRIKTEAIATGGNVNFVYFLGPNDFSVLRSTNDFTDGYHRNVYMGWGIFGWINRFVVLPIFRLLETFIDNYGVIILFLVIIIKLLLFPIAYRSYKSMATMRVLKPELDEIKERVGGDMQKQQQEQMKLYQSVGVNPLVAGCVPQLLQMPVLLALFNFFPNSIELRHQSFLWADDLSTYDAIISWQGAIPFLGSHISIFTLLMTVSTLAYTYYNNQINTTAQGPVKYMGYAMPVIFFFVLNSYSSGLTFYYFVSNLITISQQLLSTRFIDKEKIRAKLEKNKKDIKDGTKKKSSFQKRLDEAMKAQQEARKNK